MLQIDAFLSFTIAMSLLLGGKVITMNAPLLRRYSIPEPVVGGVLCAAVVGLIYVFSGRKVTFTLGARDFLLLVFFASIGLGSDLRTLLRGGKPLVILTALATLFMLMQNGLGVVLAEAFGFNPLAGLMVGSISLTGGVGTTLAWSPVFVHQHGVSNAMELGIAANTVGLIAACVIGGPMATWLIKRHGLHGPAARQLDIGSRSRGPTPPLDYFSVVWALLVINLTIMLGMGLHALIAETGVTLPAFVGCLLAGIIVRNATPLTMKRNLARMWPGVRQGMALVSDIALGVFLTMALMGLQLWELSGALVFIFTVLTLQILLTIAWTMFVVFRAMGSDYEAAVVCAGFGGITLGSTATAVANITAVAQQHGAAHRAFIIVPLVAGFFIDLVNAAVISSFIAVLG
ncbi:sodium/glutamate symporter [Camelimonas fluminis]|uniref:Sodium/glutamate symporter n=1 Tax=Camelimonas fluminis TaxID=1576911 RepID=A0ABV7UEQ3_9HYPH|nr:sodium/glutamate symporter [Camelimonas fluminis]